MSEHDDEHVEDLSADEEEQLEAADESESEDAEVEEPEAPPAAMMPSIAPEPAAPAPPAPAGPSAAVTGPKAVDPARRRSAGPLRIPVGIYCGVVGMRPPSDAGFKAWSALNGHALHTREEWSALFETYRNTKVES